MNNRVIFEDVNPDKLHNELIAAGISPLSVSNDLIHGEYIASKTEITFDPDVDMIAVQAVIDAHDPTPLPQPLTPIEQLEEENAFLALELAATQGRLNHTEQEQSELLLLLVMEGVI